MPIPLVIASTLFFQTATPQDRLERTWNQLARAEHHEGSWRVEHAGTVYAGDWAIESAADLRSSYAGHAIGQGWIHYVGTATGDHCSIAIDAPRVLHCRNKRSCPQRSHCRTVEIKLDADAPLAAGRVTAGRGSLQTALRPAAPKLATELGLFARIYEQPLEAELGGATTRWLRAQVELELRYVVPISKPIAVPGNVFGPAAYDQTAAGMTATITLGPLATDAHITTHERERFTERCTYSALSSCHPAPPTCVRR